MVVKPSGQTSTYEVTITVVAVSFAEAAAVLLLKGVTAAGVEEAALAGTDEAIAELATVRLARAEEELGAVLLVSW